MSREKHYLVCWLLNNHKLYLLWCDGGSKPDYYVLSNDEQKGQLLITLTKQEIKNCAEKKSLWLSQQPPYIFDFDALKTCLGRIRSDRPISQQFSELFLEAWNILDDVSYSTNIQLIPIDLISHVDINRVYEKLFFGNNLSAVMPSHKKYHPILDVEERKALKMMFNYAINKINEIAISSIV